MQNHPESLEQLLFGLEPFNIDNPFINEQPQAPQPEQQVVTLDSFDTVHVPRLRGKLTKGFRETGEFKI